MRFITLIILLFAFGCSSKQLSSEEYLSWVEDKDNGWFQEKQVSPIAFKVQYKPIDYLILNDFEKQIPSKLLYEEAKKKYSNTSYYVLKVQLLNGKSILKEGIQEEEEYYKRLYYCSYQMKDDIYLETSKGKIPCVYAHFERVYDLSQELTFVLTFDSKEEEQTLVIDSPLFSVGVIKFEFNITEKVSLQKPF